MRLTVFLALLALLWIPASVAASDQDSSVRLGIEAVDADGPYFDVSLDPGESTDLTVRFANHGEVATGATVYAADVYTIPGGGMGIQQLGEPGTGPTEWLTLENQELELHPDEAVEQTFTVNVPEDAAPGDYIAAVVIQNTDPIDVGDDQNQFNQTVRQGVAVNIDVPGPREPALEINDTAQTNAGDSSLILFELQNTGNTHLRLEGQVSISDDTGDVVAETPVALDTVYAGTDTVLEVRLRKRLEPGRYDASVRLEDADLGEEWSRDGIVLEVSGAGDEPVAEEPAPDDGGGAGLVVGPEDSGPGAGVWAVAVLSVVALASLLVALLIYFRRPSPHAFRPVEPARPRPHPHPQPQSQSRIMRSRPSSSRTSQPIRQLQPRRRSG